MQLPCTVKTLRIRLRLSQRQLASRMSVPRTYVSKIENSKALPALPSLERLALALEVSVGELLNGAERVRRDETAELAGDKFVAELMPFFGKLTQEQMATVLIEVQALARRRVALGGLPCVARVVSLVGARGTTGHISAIS